jgi:hypothetical protein
MHTVLATARLNPGDADVEAACAEGDEALGLVTKLRSVRGSEQLAGFVRDLEPYRSHPVVRDFTERAGEALAVPTVGRRV